jgi:hypothetical protein
MRSGAETLAGIEDALRDLAAQEATLKRELEEANRRRADLVGERLEAFKAMAAARARDALADGVIDDADNLATRVRGLLEARQRTVAALEARHREAERQREALIVRETDLKAEIAALEERLDRLAATAREELAAETAFREAKATSGSLADILQKALAKAEQAARDEQEKGLPYRNDPLFLYLWRQQYGTPRYAATGLVRALDQWVAGLVRYPDARANYALLTEIPVRLRAHADAMRRQADEARERVEAMVSERIRALAGGDLVADLASRREQQAGLDRSLDAVASEITEAGSQLATYAKAEDQSFQAAVKVYAEFLEREPLRRLLREASETRSRADDDAVADIARIGTEIDEIARGESGRRRRLDQITERRSELTRLASDFRRRRYDDVGSEFDDNPRMEDLLQMLLRGAITIADYWMRSRMQHHWRHRPADPWRRQSGLPPFGGFPGGWGGSGGGGGSRGGSGKDFETGGTF